MAGVGRYRNAIEVGTALYEQTTTDTGIYVVSHSVEPVSRWNVAQASCPSLKRCNDWSPARLEWMRLLVVHDDTDAVAEVVAVVRVDAAGSTVSEKAKEPVQDM